MLGVAGRSWPAGLLLLALSTAQWHRTWLTTLLLRWMRLALRRRAYRRALPLPARLVAGARVGTAAIAGSPCGVVRRPDGLVMVLEPVGEDLRALLRTAGTLPVGARLVLHRGPGPDRPRAWLALMARRDADTAGDDLLGPALGNAVRRLRRAGHRLAALSEPDLAATIASLAHTGPGRGVLTEDWSRWRAGPITQICVRVEAAPIEHLFALVRNVALTVAVSPAADAAVVRIAAATPAAAEAAVARLIALGPHTERLDGRHGPAVADTLPIGGTLS